MTYLWWNISEYGNWHIFNKVKKDPNMETDFNSMIIYKVETEAL